ncbi:hypothetical protein Pelo_6616 [Pelomyxa schiedti]|nr:hypothetical protein Pelo_6616 [Pelomyxa schiedti]
MNGDIETPPVVGEPTNITIHGLENQQLINNVHSDQMPNDGSTPGILPTLAELTPLVKTRGPFLYNLIASAGILALSFVVWFCVSIATTWFPWFIGPMALCALSLSTHFYLFIRPKEWFNCHIAWFATLNCLFLTTWLACNTYSVFPIYTFVILGCLLGIHKIFILHRAEKRLFALYCHSCVSIAVNICLFFLYLDTRDSTRFPWFVFPMMCGSLVFLAHYSYQYKLDFFTIHTYFFVSCQLWLIIVWEVCGPTWPWFFIPLFLWSILLGVHYYKFLPKKSASTENPVTVVPSPAPFGSVPEGNMQSSVFAPIPTTTNDMQQPPSTTTVPVMVLPTTGTQQMPPQLYPSNPFL